MIDDLSIEEYSNYLAYGDRDDNRKDLQRFLEEFLEGFDAEDVYFEETVSSWTT
jgi:hypothetical protein